MLRIESRGDLSSRGQKAEGCNRISTLEILGTRSEGRFWGDEKGRGTYFYIRWVLTASLTDLFTQFCHRGGDMAMRAREWQREWIVGSKGDLLRPLHPSSGWLMFALHGSTVERSILD